MPTSGMIQRGSRRPRTECSGGDRQPARITTRGPHGVPLIVLDWSIVRFANLFIVVVRPNPRLERAVANDIEGEREVRFADDKADDSIRRFIGPVRDINEFYFDVAYAGTPVQCDIEDETCEVMKRELRFVPAMSKDEGNQ